VIQIAEKVSRNIGILRRELTGRPVEFHNPQAPDKIVYEKLVDAIVSLTGLDERSAMSFLRYIASDPYLYVIYGIDGKVLDWDSRATGEEIRIRADHAFSVLPGVLSYKIFLVTVTMEKVGERP